VMLPDEAVPPAYYHRKIIHHFRCIVHWQYGPAR
jgi:hypothetical protein